MRGGEGLFSSWIEKEIWLMQVTQKDCHSIGLEGNIFRLQSVALTLRTRDYAEKWRFSEELDFAYFCRDARSSIISGKSKVRFGTTIQSVARYLNDGTHSSPKAQDTKQIREQETKRLEKFISENNLWIDDIDFSQYVSEGAEQRVYLKDSDHVLKLKDAIYYSYWKDYFHNLLLHNFFFSDTAYELIGFTKENNVLYAVVQQSFVTISQTTDLNEVKAFLGSNGFLTQKTH
jgi:Serine/Threonine/Tyrosine Kinase found in polyvalent proteins